MRKYDLHIHSKFSDGDYSVEEIVDRVKDCGIEIFSITDHDNIESIKAMQSVNKKGLTYIPGVELSCERDGYKMHILGYNVDGNDSQLIETCRDMKLRKNIRNLEIIQQLKERFGIVISREETEELLSRKGFVGQTTIARLLVQKGIIPNIKYAFDNYFKHMDLKTPATIDLNKAVKVIHSAGGYAVLAHPISIENPILYQEVNCLGTQNILEEMKEHNIKKLVMASSSSVYGNCKEVPFTEDMIVDFAISPYAATKKANEVMTHVYHKLFDFNVVMLRFFTVYGPKQRPDLAINKFTRLMLEDKEIPMFGDGTTSRDYTYIDDIVDGIMKACEYCIKNANVYEILNMGNSSPISLKDMINTIGKVLGIEPKIKQLPMQPGDVDRTYADISKAKKIIGYTPKVSFEQGISSFIEWYKKQ